MSSKGIITIIVILFVIALGIFFLSQPETGEPGDGSATTTDQVSDMEDGVDSDGTASTNAGSGETTVRYTNDGFVPSAVTVAQGETVRFVNESTRGMWVASAMHPTHEVYGGTTLREHCPDGSAAFDQCEDSNEFSFTFEKAGQWSYHNHVNAADTGRVVVTE